MSSQSSLTGNILGAIGAGVGAFFGGPVGAAQGYALGSALGNAIDPPKGPTIEGPRLADKSIQVSTYGAMLPRFYGTIGVSGNITWLENNQLKETVRKKKSGGKGGGSAATTKIYTYSATFILSLGIGPIAGVRRIWCGDKLIYNAGSDDLETIIASNQAASGFRIYLGTDDQLPEPRYEADVGVGNASAFRGEAYIAFYDFQLADFANSLQAAQFKVEVVSLGSYEPFVLIRSTSYDGQDVSFANGYSYDSTNTVKVLTAPSGTLTGQQITVHELFSSGETFSRDLTSSYPEAVQAFQVQGDLAPFLKDNTGYSAAGVFYPSVQSGDFFIKEGDDLWMLAPIYPVIARLIPNSTGITIPAEAGEYGIAKIGSSIYTLKPGQIREIDADTLAIQQIIPMALSLPGSGGVNSRFFAGDSRLWHVNAASGSGSSSHLYKLTEDFTDVEQIYLFSHPNVSSASTYSHSVSNNVYTRSYRGIDGLFHVEQFQLDAFSQSLAQLSEIIESEISLSSLLDSSDINTSLISDSVRGYKVSGGSIRSALEPLQGAFPFDVIQSGYQLKCVPRGQSSALTISWEDLVTDGSQDIGEILKESREMDSQLTVRTNIKYLDAAREYAIAEQYSERPNTQAINRVDREFPIVITADEAAKVADVLNNLPWQERTTAQTSLPPTMLALEPSDVITLTTPFATYEYRIADSRYTANGSIDIQVRTNNAAIYTSSAEGSEGVPPVGTIPLQGPTLWVPMDIPVVDETVQNSPGFGSVATGFTSGWNGAVAFRTVDSGQTWSEIQGYTGIPTIGYARTALAANTGHVIQKTSLVIDLLSGELESITRDQMIAGQNYVAYGADGRWEIIRFQNATLQADGSYLVSNFVRGDKGTEWATGLHAAGDYFVLLDDPDHAFIDMAVASIGIYSTYRGVSNGSSIDSASDVPFTYQGVNLEPLSAVTPNGVRDVSGNFAGSFYRRSRLSSSWWTTGVPAPIGETTESYEIDVMSGSTLKRTISTSTPSFSYSAADQTTDFGSAQASITFRIYQLSEIVGRGYVLETTL